MMSLMWLWSVSTIAASVVVIGVAAMLVAACYKSKFEDGDTCRNTCDSCKGLTADEDLEWFYGWECKYWWKHCTACMYWWRKKQH